MKKILIVVPFEEEGKKRLEAVCPENEYIYKTPDTVTEEDVSDVDAIIGNVPAPLMKYASKLEWFQSQMAGVDAYIKNGVIGDDVVITNVTGAFGLAISEHMVGCVFELYKKLHLYRDNQNEAVWQDMGSVKQIEGQTVLVVGLGDIGNCFAKKMKALGAYTVGIKRRMSPKPDYIDELYLQDSLDSVLPKADIVALCMPDTVETRGMFSAERISKMKDGATLINIGRGSAIDTDALCSALENGKLYGAALDVFEKEPLPSDHKLWKLKNAIITPHISGFFHLRKTYDNIIDICIKNYENYVDGRPFINIIDRETGYCK
ncbi:MAG: D-2-hydroxyacid dehydrogenase [Ruminococcaceae bacterium]|nr:D-2-hydroxyacid dehydrogenase [Oscillospiraceae bacterium]